MDADAVCPVLCVSRDEVVFVLKQNETERLLDNQMHIRR